MCNCRDQRMRIVKMTSDVAGEMPTIPSSDNHRDGTWQPTDIYIGESFWNAADGIMYERTATGIVIVGQNNPNGVVKRYKAILSQSSTNAPTEVFVLENNFGDDFEWAYDSVGFYYVNNYAALGFGSGIRATIICGGSDADRGRVNGFIDVNGVPYIETSAGANVAQNAVLDRTTVIIEIYPEPPVS